LVGCVVVSSTAAVMIWREKKQTDAERIKAMENADAAIHVVRNLSNYAESYEMGSTTAAANDMQRKDRLDAALASYERLLRLRPDDEPIRFNVARMHRLSANLSSFLDKMAEAEKFYSEAIRNFDQLAADHPERSFYREQAALTRRDFGAHLQKLGRHQEATRFSEDCIRLYEELQRAKPEESNYQRMLAYLLIGRSDRDLQVGRLAESEQAARKAEERYAKLADMPGLRPETFDPLFHAMADHNRAMALRELGHLDEAIAAHDRAVERMAGLITVTINRDAWSFYHRARTERAWTLARFPDRTAAAIADLESANLGWDKLIKQVGESPLDLHRKGVASLYCGRIKMLLGQRESAGTDLSAAARILEGLIAKQPEIPVYRYDLGRTCTALGQLSSDQQEAARWYRQGREMLEAAVQRYPENVQYRQALTELEALATAKP
ncbi:MAG: hypothetical protein ACJ8F7_00580, partial [Gemmataceae bacterium]